MKILIYFLGNIDVLSSNREAEERSSRARLDAEQYTWKRRAEGITKLLNEKN